MWRVTADPLAFQEAIEWLRERVPLTQDDFRKLDRDAARKAFTVAAVAQLDLVVETLTSLQQAVRDGIPYEDWAATIGPKLTAAWGVERPWRLELIFRQNVLSAYAAGRYHQQTRPEVIKARPFWLYDSVLDSGTTRICRDYNGTLLPADHPWWRKRYPPNHFGCRSGVRSLTQREAERRGISKEAPELEPPGGFDTEPGSDWKPNLDQDKYKNFPEVKPKLSPGEFYRQRLEQVRQEWADRLDQAERDLDEAVQAVLQGAGDLAELIRRRVAAKRALDQVREERNRAAREALYRDGGEVELEVSPKVKGKLRRAVEEGAREFERLTGLRVGPVRVGLLSESPVYRWGARSHYVRNGIYLESGETPEVVIHELAHALEEANATLRDRVHTWLDDRTKGDRLERLRDLTGLAYAPHELTRKDRFRNPYVGKEYRDSQGQRFATEVTSMGVQWLYQEPLEFVRDDPEMFDLLMELFE